MSTASKRDAREQARLRAAQMKAEQQRADKRRTRLISLVVVLAILAVAIPTTILIAGEQSRRSALDLQREEVVAAAGSPIEGEEVLDVPSATHLTEDVPEEDVLALEADEGRLPPVGGDHDPVVQNCGFYSEPVRDEHAVHSLEHGAVWVTYRNDLEDDQLRTLRDLAAENPYLLVSPYEELAAPLVATAWGVQVQVDTVTDERLLPFLARYLESPEAPEPGAPCQGGVG